MTELADPEGNNFTGLFEGTHYVKFKDGPGAGEWYSVSVTGDGTIDIDLNGATISAVSGNQFEVLKFWTLDELFPPTESDTDPALTGNAIVASTSTSSLGRRTSLLYPDITTAGTNLSASAIYFIYNDEWRKSGETGDFGSTQLWPDVYFTIRHAPSVNSATTYTVIGQVETGTVDIPLNTVTTGFQDNFIGITRPVDVTLNSLNLGGTAAFVSSTSTSSLGRRDSILVFDNAAALQNKSASAIYFFHEGIWKKSGANNDDFGSDVIPAGHGFIIRKYETGGGETAIWKNTSSY